MKLKPVKKGEVLVLRTCDKDMLAYGGFRWKKRGWVEAPDWDPKPICGHGLHGALWGEGDGNLFDWDQDAKWLVVAVPEDTVVDLGGKVKFPRGRVVHCGDRESATRYLSERVSGKALIGGTATAGDRGTATAGDYGTLLIQYYDYENSRYRFVIGYVGEDGIEPRKPYRANDSGEIVEAAV